MKRLFFLLLIITIMPTMAYCLEYPNINSKMVEVYDLTDNEVLYEVDSNKKTSIASLTKIATTITAIENIKNLDEEVTITKDILKTVSWDASKAGLKVGDKVTYLDLLYASMLPSGADATNSIAILSSGSIDKFVDKMNALAKKIHLKNTHFVNVTGLDDKEHYSTADDVRTLLAYSLKNPLFKKIYSTREYKLTNGLKVKSTIVTYNKKSSVNTSKIIGSKTGYTGDAGYCLSSLSNANGHEILIIVLKANHVGVNYYNIVDTVKLIDFVNSHYKDEILVEKNHLIKTIHVSLSDVNNYKVIASDDVKKYLPDDYDKNDIKIKYDGLEELSYKNKIGEKIGTIKYYYKDKLVAKEEVKLDKKLNFNLGKFIKKYYYIIIGIVVLIIITGLIIIKNKRKIRKRSRIRHNNQRLR